MTDRASQDDQTLPRVSRRSFVGGSMAVTGLGLPVFR